MDISINIYKKVAKKLREWRKTCVDIPLNYYAHV